MVFTQRPKNGTGERTVCPLPRAKFHVYRGKNVGIQPQNCKQFEFWPDICTSGATRLQYFYEILSICTRLVWSLSRDKHPSYKHFPAVGAFSHQFSMAHSGETTDRIKLKLGGWGCKNKTDLLYHHAKYGGDPGSCAGCRRKSVIFLSVCFLSRFGMTKFVITETL